MARSCSVLRGGLAAARFASVPATSDLVRRARWAEYTSLHYNGVRRSDIPYNMLSGISV